MAGTTCDRRLRQAPLAPVVFDVFQPAADSPDRLEASAEDLRPRCSAAADPAPPRQYLRRLLDESSVGRRLPRARAGAGRLVLPIGVRDRDRPSGRRTAGSAGRRAHQGHHEHRRAEYAEQLRAGRRPRATSTARGPGRALARRRAGSGRPTTSARPKTAGRSWPRTTTARLTSDGRENIVDDYCALLAAPRAVRATRQPRLQGGRRMRRATRSLARLSPRRAYWRAATTTTGPSSTPRTRGCPWPA